MRIYMLWGQRKGSYPGQYAPELLASIEEHGNDDNPDYLLGEEKKYRDSYEFESIVVAQAVIPDEFLKMVLFPKNEIPITGFKSE